jgi:hypothetical protein
LDFFIKKQDKGLGEKTVINWIAVIATIIGFAMAGEWMYKAFFKAPNPEFYFKPSIMSLPGHLCIQPANDAAKNFKDDLYITLERFKRKVGKLKKAKKVTPNSYCNNNYWRFDLTDKLHAFLKSNKPNDVVFYFAEHKKSDTYKLFINQSPPSYQLKIEPAKDKKQNSTYSTG